MPSDLERRIQQLCADVVATNDSERLNQLCRELQEALSRHIGGLRDQVKEYRNLAARSRPPKEED
jgi:hypothetical protein